MQSEFIRHFAFLMLDMTRTVEISGEGGPLGIHVVPFFSSLSGRILGLFIRGIEENSRSKREGLFHENECIVKINNVDLVDKTFAQAQDLFRQAMKSPSVLLRVLPPQNREQYEKSVIGPLNIFGNNDRVLRTKEPPSVLGKSGIKTINLTGTSSPEEDASSLQQSKSPRVPRLGRKPSSPSLSPLMGFGSKKNAKKIKIDLKKGEPDCCAFSLETTEQLTFEIPLNDSGSAGLGVSLKGNKSRETGTDLGIFIKSIIHGGAAFKEPAECGAFSKPCFENCQNAVTTSRRNDNSTLHPFGTYSPQDKQKDLLLPNDGWAESEVPPSPQPHPVLELGLEDYSHSSGVDSAVYFPDQHINFRSVTPARQPESMNLKASKSMDLASLTHLPLRLYFHVCRSLSISRVHTCCGCLSPAENIWVTVGCQGNQELLKTASSTVFKSLCKRKKNSSHYKKKSIRSTKIKPKPHVETVFIFNFFVIWSFPGNAKSKLTVSQRALRINVFAETLDHGTLYYKRCFSLIVRQFYLFLHDGLVLFISFIFLAALIGTVPESHIQRLFDEVQTSFTSRPESVVAHCLGQVTAVGWKAEPPSPCVNFILMHTENDVQTWLPARRRLDGLHPCALRGLRLQSHHP
ncbi:hypothetical protein FD755_007236 [Muntiacus reevesi]|uniref:PDZ domain-containing protein n=1 Tax=Muntiacus reevesi TaxID=9886 RepID=A0A5J5MIX2_MUNRE|nr:hypothetical protein FD755_007236 [Muntiacus reevesi]